MLTRTVSSGPQLAAFELKNWHDLIKFMTTNVLGAKQCLLMKING
jgi:hypothetical protein